MGECEWASNEHGFWCMCCGNLIGSLSADEDTLPDECGQCGYPDAAKVADYHCGGGDDDDDEDEGFAFECAMGPDGYCPLAGSEECDWECREHD